MTLRSNGSKLLVALSAGGVLIAGLATAGGASAAPPSRPTASVANNTLTIIGTPGDDKITVFGSADPSVLLVDFADGTVPLSFARQNFNSVAAFLEGGDDQFVASRTSAVLDEPITVNGGAGDDAILGGDNNDTLSGGPGNDSIQGGPGNDVIFGNGGYDVVDGGIGSDTLSLGADDDVAQWNPGEGSDVIEGGAGQDRLDFNGSNIGETMSLSANGDQAVFLRNVAAIRMDMDGVEDVHLKTLGGADTLTVNDLRGTDVRQLDVDEASSFGTPDGSLDSVTVNGTNRADDIAVAADSGAVDVSGLHTAVNVAGGESTDQLNVNGLGGNDSIQVSDAATALLAIVADLGSGQH